VHSMNTIRLEINDYQGSLVQEPCVTAYKETEGEWKPIEGCANWPLWNIEALIDVLIIHHGCSEPSGISQIINNFKED
jgi:hypothetical protein